MDLHAIVVRALTEVIRSLGGTVPHEYHVVAAQVPAGSLYRLRHELQAVLGPSWHLYTPGTGGGRIDIDHEGRLVATLRSQPVTLEGGAEAVSLRVEYFA